MDFFELHAEFRVYVPAERGAEEAGAEVVHAVFRIAEHDCEILWDVLQQDVQGMHISDDGFVLEDAVLEDVAFGLGVNEREVLRVASTVELQGVLHDLFAR